jgi:parvulin-like peptidyl-prolyl isomerase
MIPKKSSSKSQKIIFVVGMVALCISLAFGCSKNEEENKRIAKGYANDFQVVAKIGEHKITEAEFRSYLSGRPVFQSQVAKNELAKRLDALILEEVLYQEAIRQKLDQNPDIRSRIRQMLTQELIDEQVNDTEWHREITDEELQNYYDQHWYEFNRPEQVRLADIFLEVPTNATEDEQSEIRKKAEAILDKAFKARGARSGFGSLIRKHSDIPEKYSKGDTGFFDKEGKPIGIHQQLAEAAFRLERVGSMAENVIESSDGYHIIMLIGKRSAVHRPMELVRKDLIQRIRRESVVQARQKYIDSLRERARIQIDEQVMDSISNELFHSQSLEQNYKAEKANLSGSDSTNPVSTLKKIQSSKKVYPPALPYSKN